MAVARSFAGSSRRARAFVAVVTTSIATAAATLLVGVGPAGAAGTVNLYVDPAGTATTGCATPATACAKIEPALKEADTLFAAGDATVVVHIAAGTYAEHLVVNKMDGNDSLTLLGASAATTIIDGGGSGRDLTSHDARGGKHSITITNLTLQHGRSANDFYNGGAIEARAANVTIVNSILKDNVSGGTGGQGGAVSTVAGSITVGNSTISGNKADRGGALATLIGTIRVLFSTITGNTALGDGGALYANEGAVKVGASTISDNTGTNGGGIYSRDAAVDIVTSTFAGNSGTVGGAVDTDTASITATNSTFFDGAPAAGGGLASTAGAITVQQSTLAKNSGIANAGGTTTISGSLLSGSSCAGRTVDAGGNLGTDATCGFSAAHSSVVNANPGLATALADNGSTETQTLALPIDSAARNVTPQAQCEEVDQRGSPRAGVVCDAGAYEYAAGAQPIAKIAISGTSFAVGNTVKYTVGLTNTSVYAQADNPGAEFTITLPAGLTAEGGSGGVSISGQTVSWNGAIDGGVTRTFTFRAKIGEALSGQTVISRGTLHYDALGNNVNAAQRDSNEVTFTVAALAASSTTSSIEAATAVHSGSGSGSGGSGLASTGSPVAGQLGLGGLLLLVGGGLLLATRRRARGRHTSS